MIYPKYELNSMYLKERRWFLWAIHGNKFIFGHCSFLCCVVMFNLTTFWVRENSISFFEFRNTEILLSIRRRIIHWALSCLQTALHDWRLISVCRVLASPGARFSKVPIINGPGKLLPFTLKIEDLMVLHLTWWNYQLIKQNGVVC